MEVGCGPAERDGRAGGGGLDVVSDRVEGGGGTAQEAHADGAFEPGEAGGQFDVLMTLRFRDCAGG
jgi:hypothetical protein